MTTPKSTTQQLATFGLSEKEIQVYYTLLRLGIARANEVARETNIPRQTVYSMLTTLIRIGLVDQHDRRGVKHFSTEPRRVLDLMRAQRETIAEQERAIEKELPALETVRMRPAPLPHIQYYEGDEGLRRLFDSILVQHKKGEKVFRGWGVNMMHAAAGEHIFDFIKKRAALDVTTKLFIGQGPDDLGLEKGKLGRNVKRLTMSAQNAALYVAGDNIYLFSYVDRVGLVIENRAIATLLSAVFEDQWLRVK